MAHVEPLRLPAPRLLRWAVWGTFVALVGLVSVGATQLWSEVRALLREKDDVIHSQIIGFEGVTFDVNFAEKPPNWVHDEGGSTLLWARWEPGVGHQWFRFPEGDLAALSLKGNFARDSIRTVQRPIVEVGGGRRWERIPWDLPVVAFDLNGIACAYPLVILRKTLVVHDDIQGRRIVVVLTPATPTGEGVCLYDLTGAEPLALGHSGYFLENRPVLYDRQSESLWLPGAEALEAIAGRQKGACRPILEPPVLVGWSDWQARHPDGRLLVGADRRGDPTAH